MSADTDKLREMINVAPAQSENIGNSISDITVIRDEYNEQISAVQNGMCGSAQSQMTAYLTTVKLVQFQLTYPTAELTFGGTYGTIVYSTGNITDWEIWYDLITPTVPPAPAIPPVKTVLYEYEGIGWDSDTQIITWADDYSFGNDYLTRLLSSGATYGLIPYRDNLDTAIGLLTSNQNKIDDSISYLEDYAT